MKLLNVGGNSKKIELPPYFKDWEHHLLDIDPAGEPDICADARDLDKQDCGVYDGVYCSHTLEHFYFHEIPKLIKNFSHITNENGMIWVAVPNIPAVMKKVTGSNLDLLDPLYRLGDGTPISTMDVLYGWGRQLVHSGKDYFSHKCGFSARILGDLVANNGFPHVSVVESDLELTLLGFKKEETAKQYKT